MGSEARLSLALALTLTVLATVGVGLAAAHPHEEPDHGVNETTFPVLWSGDADGNVTAGGQGDDETIAIRQLANGTDVPLNSPPRDVETWNDGELGDFPSTDRSVSIRPSGAETEDGRFVRDAHATLFAVQPSTRARLSSSSHPLYVAEEGAVLGTTDYRVRVPEDDTTGSRQVYWSLQEHRIDESRLLVDGDEETTRGGSHTPRFEFDGLDDGDHTVTLATDVYVQLEKHVRTERTVCEGTGSERTCRTVVDHDYYYPDESVTVSDEIDVVSYDLAVSGERAQYPDGTTELALTADSPWLGHTLPNGNVTGVLRFYSARDSDWDTLVYSTEDGATLEHSPLHPLQVNAFPLEMGPSTSQVNATVLDSDGEQRNAPSLPDNVNLDVPNDSYTGSETLVTRVPGEITDVRARGLVRGTGTRVDVDWLDAVEIRQSNLTISTINETRNATTVTIQLRDNATGQPINTADRNGYIVVNGERLNTTGNGTVTTKLDRSGAIISARYEPGDWWRDGPGYVGDSASHGLRGPTFQTIATLVRFAIPVALFLLAVYLIDRITHWQIWPPWRGM